MDVETCSRLVDVDVYNAMQSVPMILIVLLLLLLLQTLVNQTGAPTPITPHAFAGCKCDGSDECEPVVHYPLIVLKRSGCPCPSSAPNHPHNNNNDGDDDDDDEPRPLSIQPLLPPRLCPTTCSIDLTDGSTRTGACYSSLPARGGCWQTLTCAPRAPSTPASPAAALPSSAACAVCRTTSTTTTPSPDSFQALIKPLDRAHDAALVTA